MHLTREQRDKRIEIAKDVLKQLDRQDVPLMAKSRYGYVLGTLDIGLNPSDEIQGHADTIQKSCTVCAKGALLLSKARLYDAVPFSAIATFHMEDDGTRKSICANPGAIHDALSDIFDRFTLDMLEAAFEKSAGTIYNEEDEDDEPLYGDHEWGRLKQAAWYGSTYTNDVDRVRACMQNLITNDGEFILPDTDA
jgi:hypothetical protein